MLTDEAAELEGYAVCADELEIGNAGRRLGCKRLCLDETLVIQARQPHEAVPTSDRNLLGRIVGTEKPVLIVFVNGIIDAIRRAIRACPASERCFARDRSRRAFNLANNAPATTAPPVAYPAIRKSCVDIVKPSVPEAAAPRL